MRKIYAGIAYLGILVGTSALSLLPAGAAGLTPAQPNDNLNAVLWDQTSEEFKANAMGAYALGHLRLDEALADKSWTASRWSRPAIFRTCRRPSGHHPGCR